MRRRRDTEEVYDSYDSRQEISGPEEDRFTGDDTYDVYHNGVDLSDDPMAKAGTERVRRKRKPKTEQDETADGEISEKEWDGGFSEKEQRHRMADPQTQSRYSDTDEGYDSESDEEGDAEERDPRRSRVSSAIMAFISGNILSRNEVRRIYPYLLFIAFLAFLYIANVFHMQQLYRRHDRLTTQVKELRAQSMTLASQKMRATRQSSILREIERRGLPLKESLEPNRVIEK